MKIEPASMSLGLEVAFLPGFAIARRLDKDGDIKRHLLLTPAFGLLTCLGLAGICFILEWSLGTLTSLMILANIAAFVAIRVELNPVHVTNRIDRAP
jgi:hypothetical protein